MEEEKRWMSQRKYEELRQNNQIEPDVIYAVIAKENLVQKKIEFLKEIAKIEEILLIYEE